MLGKEIWGASRLLQLEAPSPVPLFRAPSPVHEPSPTEFVAIVALRTKSFASGCNCPELPAAPSEAPPHFAPPFRVAASHPVSPPGLC